MKIREIVEISSKGQLLIPKYYREIAGIKKGEKVALTAEPNKLIVTVLPDDPNAASRGMLKGKESPAKRLLKERREESKRKG